MSGLLDVIDDPLLRYDFIVIRRDSAVVCKLVLVISCCC